MVGKCFVQRIELASEQQGGVRDRVAGWVIKHPYLVILAQDRIRPDSVHHRYPTDRRRLKAVNEKHGNFFRVVRLNLYEASLGGEFVRVEQRRHSHFLGMLARQANRYRRSKICRQWQRFIGNANGLGIEWVDEFDLALPTTELRYRSR